MFSGNSECGIRIAPGNGNIGRVFGKDSNGETNGFLLMAITFSTSRKTRFTVDSTRQWSDTIKITGE